MAPSNHPKPIRALGVLGLIVIALVAAMIGTSTYLPKLGLDLSGGTTVTLHPVTQKGERAPESAVEQAVDIIRQRVNALGVSEAEVTKQGENIVVAVPGQGQQKVVQQVGQTAQLRFRQVLLAQPVSSGPTKSPSPAQSSGAESSGGNADTAGEQETPSNSRAMSGVLRSGPGSESGAAAGGAAQPSPAPTGGSKLSKQEIMQRLKQQQLAQQGVQQTDDIDKDVLAKFKEFTCKPGASRGRLLDPQAQIVACNKDGTVKYVLGPAEVKGTMVTDAQAALPGQGTTGGWMVTLDFNGTGGTKWADFTTRLSGKQPPRDQAGIVLDGVVVSAPQVQAPITGGETQITGNFGQQEAEDLSTILRYGSLPLNFEKSEIQHISSTLGASQLRAGLIAGGLGLILVAVYSLLYYRALGLVSVAGLVAAMGISYSAVVLLGLGIGYRLSLAGIAGLIVSIGITVDSFVVYFERLRDEIRDGRSPRSAVERSWLRARRTILTADTVSFLAAAVLWVLAVGDVKGFAFTLGLTTLVDILVIFIFTKPLLTVLARTRFFGDGHPMSGLDPARLGAKRGTTPGMRGTTTPREV